ncbi:MAG: ATP-binding protein [Woeseiaceae bacterium]|nr:ATP-binding protein [Woeseiaceae bacterium]
MLSLFGIAIYACFLVYILKSRVSIVRDSVIVIGMLSSMAAGAYLFAGFMPGAVLTSAFILLLSALLFGLRLFLIMLALHVALLAGIVIALSMGVWQGPDPAEMDPSSAVVWIRTGLITITIWTTFGLAVLYVLNTIQRVSEKRRAALEELQSEIEERQAAEHARRQAEDVALQAQKMEAVGQLAAGIAHDVNNALLVIRGWNELRGELDLSDEQREASSAIEQAAMHTTQLTRQLLTFARKEFRSPRYLNLDDVVGESIKTLRALVGTNTKIEWRAGGRALVHADESQLQQLLFNLVINARDALEGEGTIHIRVRPAERPDAADAETAPEEWVALEVEDSGPGIPEEAQGRVFEPFFTTKGPEKGTGLGLSTVLEIVQQSAGHIDVDSRPGRTVFSVYLPLVDSERAHMQEADEDIEVTDLGLRILVLEDDPLARQIIVAALERSGNEVVECASGDAAVDVLATDAEHFDLLCSDAEFPGAKLETVLEAFERHSPDARVLICSGYVRDESAIREIGSGEHAFLAKPFTGSQLTARISRIVSERESG